MTARSAPRCTLSAYVVPFAIFMAGIALTDAVRRLGSGTDALLLQHPEHWIYPLQTLACGAALVYFWKEYDFGVRGGWLEGVAGGLLALGIWISPQSVFGFAPRLQGFDPTGMVESPILYWLVICARFARLVVVVPLLEEVFWRGFLLRYMVREDFVAVAFGTFRPVSFFGVAGLFMLAHSTADWPAAFLTGMIYNWLAVRTKSLTACVIAHAVTNFGLGVYIMSTEQWGFW